MGFASKAELADLPHYCLLLEAEEENLGKVTMGVEPKEAAVPVMEAVVVRAVTATVEATC